MFRFGLFHAGCSRFDVAVRWDNMLVMGVANLRRIYVRGLRNKLDIFAYLVKLDVKVTIYSEDMMLI
jgi:hypothetical protein